MSLCYTKTEDFDEVVEKLGVETVGKDRYTDSEILLRKYQNLNHKDQKCIPTFFAIMSIVEKLDKQKEEIENLIKTLEEKEKALEERINQTWDGLSDRVSEVEKKFQIKKFPKKGITPYDLEKARRLYLDECDERIQDSEKFPSWEELPWESQVDYLIKYKKSK